MSIRAVLLAFVGCLAQTQAQAVGDGSYRSARKAIDATAKAFQSFDRDQDGTPEISKLTKIVEASGTGKGTVLVLVESRLLRKDKGLPDLTPSLKTLATDLGKEGLNAFVLETKFYEGSEHQDGLTLIAFRDMFRRIWLDVKDFKGVLLVGDFPQPFMVRQYAWVRDDPVTLNPGTKVEAQFKQPWIRAVAEPVVSPADIVLADMNGRWDRIYVKQPMNVAELLLVLPEGSDVSENWEIRNERYEDFFFVQDGPWSERAMGGRKVRFTFEGEPNEECAAADKKLPNPIAVPEIAVGRINARHAGLVPNPKTHGVDGKGLLDASGNPQAVDFGDAKKVPDRMAQWVPSAAFERRLLVEYFTRNHAYRSGATTATGVGEVSTGLGSDLGELRKVVPGWKNLKPTAGSFLADKITLTDLAAWMKKPFLVREIRAHSNPILAGFDRAPDVGALEKEVGPRVLYWTREGSKLVPSLKGLGGEMGFGLLRNLYENHAMPSNGVFYFHTGCESMRPLGAENSPFNAPGFAAWQLAECTMMLGNGLALVGRGKVFYDEPREFWRVMGKGGTFGDAWKRYFEVESQDADLLKNGIGRKRTYFWSVLGDFTLRLPKELTKGK